jgi:hypothetical protein
MAFTTGAAPSRAIAMATFRIRGLGALSVAASCGEQPRERDAIAWLRLSDSGSAGAVRGGGETARIERAADGDSQIPSFAPNRR